MGPKCHGVTVSHCLWCLLAWAFAMFGKRRPMFFREIQARVLRNDFLQNFYIPGKLLQMI